MVMEVWPILERASERGIPIDREEKDNLTTFLIGERKRIYESIQGKVVDEVRKIHPLEGYVRTPPEVGELINTYNQVIPKLIAEGKKVIDIHEYIARKTYKKIVKAGEEKETWRKFRYATFSIINKKTGDESREGRWCIVEDFNPNSSKQIIRYMKWRGHKVPVKLTGEETSDAKELERLAISTGDGFYDEITEYRQVSKMLTNDLPNWEPKDSTGAVHTQFGFLPATGQLNSRSPNVQNANKHKPLGKRFRRIVRARCYRDGRWAGRRRRIVELDYSGFHAIMLGREAESERYINISMADAHSWLTSYVIGKPVEYPTIFTPQAYQEFKEKLKNIKKAYKVIRDTQSKPTILGIGLGLGPRKMYWMNRPKLDRQSGQMVGIENEKKSKFLQGVVKELLPELFHYQDVIKEVAFRQSYLINEWGMIRWFFDVKGEDGEKAIAFNVQGNAHGMLRWVIRRLEQTLVQDRDTGEWVSALDYYFFNNTIHDSLCFEPFEDEVGECIRVVRGVMETPCRRLANKCVPQGLVVRAEASVGENWAEWDEKVNPGGMKVWVN
jgi:hypothetical protein